MPALQVRDFPDELYERLRVFAAANHRSIAQQTISCVESTLSQCGQSSDVDIPPNVKDASRRARAVDPCASALETEPSAATHERLARRRAAFEAASAISWRGEKPTPDEIAHMVREERESRGGLLAVGEELQLHGKAECNR